MITCTGLSKTFHDRKRGPVRAVDDVSFQCDAGEVLGVLGPNGAGKTTLLRMLATVLAPTSGTAAVAGHDIRTDGRAVRASIGYLSSATAIYERLTAREMVAYFGALHGMGRDALRARIDAVFTDLDMHAFAGVRCDRLSSGQKQRVSIARTIVHSPPVLVFDEPTNGLDVITSRAITRFIRRCRDEGRAVIFSTHIMSEVEALCDRVLVIHKGRVTASGTVPELRAATGKQALEHVFLALIGEEEQA